MESSPSHVYPRLLYYVQVCVKRMRIVGRKCNSVLDSSHAISTGPQPRCQASRSTQARQRDTGHNRHRSAQKSRAATANVSQLVNISSMSVSGRLGSALRPAWRSAIASHPHGIHGGLADVSTISCDALRCISSGCVEPPIPPGNSALACDVRSFHTTRPRLAIAQNTAMDIFDRCWSALAPFLCTG